MKIFRTVDFKLENCFQIIYWTDVIDFGSSAKNKMSAIKLFEMYVMSKLWIPLVNVISLESFHQSTSNLIYYVILPYN